MVDTLEKLNQKFNDKYKYLKLLSVVYLAESLQCTITFLYPEYIDEMSQESRNEIYNFYKDFLKLNGELRIKYKKSFLDSRLVITEVIEYFKTYKKGIFPYINIENISSTRNEQDVLVKLSINKDVLSLLDDLELKNSLKTYLDKKFIANISIEIIENEETLPESIEFDDLPVSATSKVRRYEVKLEKKLFGGDIIPKPEYISDITSQKLSVILCGFIRNKNTKTYVLKSGKNKGKEKTLFTFTLSDKWGGVIDCVYFCPKSHLKIMEALDDTFMTLCVGDIKIGISGKLTYYIKKMSVANPIELVQNTCEDEENYVHKKVVFPDPITRQMQDNFLEIKAKYNDFIMKNKFVVFDIETTGLDPEICEITELGAVKIENGEIVERFSSFAKPKFSIPIEVQQITHITDDMVKFAPRIEDVVYDFYEWSRDCIISGYNIVGFDLKFIQKIATKIGVKFDNEVIDTYIVARQSKIRPSNYKLGTVVKTLGLQLNDAHRAYNDAYATAEVLMALNKIK